METQYWYSPEEYGGSLMFQFNDPYYVAPPVVEVVAQLESTEGEWGVRSFDTISTAGDPLYVYRYSESLPQHDWGYDWETDTWVDIGSDDPKTFVISFANSERFITGYRAEDSPHGPNELIFKYSDPYYVPEPDESQKRLVATGGQREGSYDYYYMETTTPGGRFIYSLVDIGTYDVVDKIYDVEYDPSDGKWHNDEHTASPEEWAVDNTSTKSAFPTASNMEAQY